MAPRQDAILNLSHLLSHAPGADDEVHAEGLLEPSAALLEADGLRLQGPLHWRLSVRSTGGDDDFLVEGSVSGTALLECRRCLDEVPTEVGADFLFPMAYRPGGEALVLVEVDEEEEDLLVFGHPSVDFAPLLVQFLAIELPLTVLCSETCRGLSIDGVNLNRHPEHAAAEEPAETSERPSPFAVLKDLEVS